MLFWWHNEDNYDPDSIVMTVAMPVLNNSDIIWLPLDGLKNQRDINFSWELIIYEEEGLSREIIKQYCNKLPGCKRIVHRSIKKNEGMFPPSYTLLEKWINMAQISSKSSYIYVAQASDCYPPDIRLIGHYKNFMTGCDYSKRRIGLFYHIHEKKWSKYDQNLLIDEEQKKIQGLDYAVKKDLYNNIILPEYPLFCCIDHFFYKNYYNKIMFYDDYYNDAYLRGIDTDGKNNISLYRSKMVYNTNNIRHMTPFDKNDIKKSIKIPMYILDKLENF